MIAKGTSIRILGISGSGREGSYNTSLLRAASELVPPESVFEIVDVSRFPLYNEDIESEMPVGVRDFKQKIERADAVVFATPEYNYSLSAVLKNAIEWGNRPNNSWAGKPAAIISASISLRGGVRAQMQLRQILVDLDMHPINRPQLLLAQANGKFDENLRLTDETARRTLRELLAALVVWTSRLKEKNSEIPVLKHR